MRFAIIENNIVINVIDADENFINEFYPEAVNVTDKICGRGFIYRDGEFEPPASIADEDNGETL